MINISINLESGAARLSQTSAMKAGGDVPVQIVFSSNPGADPLIELALSAQTSSPSVLAYLDEWISQNSTTYTGVLDASDTRLINHLAGKQQQTLDCEVVVTVAGSRRPFPNIPITTQPPIITGPESSEGGPAYYTASQIEALIDAEIAGVEDGLYGDDGRILPEKLPAEIDARISVLTGTDVALASEVLAQGELASPIDASGLRKGDGVTPGGALVGRIASESEVEAGTSGITCIPPSLAVIRSNGGGIVCKDSSGTTAGGARGTGAIDLQRARSAGDQVASGAYSVTLGASNKATNANAVAIGSINSATGISSVVSGGTSNTASGSNSTVGGGTTNTASNNYGTVAGGGNNQATNVSDFVGGGGGLSSNANIASGGYSTIGGGRRNAASAAYSAVLGGDSGVADKTGMTAFAPGRFSAAGDAQRIELSLWRKTTNNTPTTLTLNNSTGDLVLTDGKVLSGIVNISGVKSDGSAVAHFVRQISAKRVSGTASLVAATTIGTDQAAGTSVAVSVDVGTSSLRINVTGISSETWRWVADFRGNEVAFGT